MKPRIQKRKHLPGVFIWFCDGDGHTGMGINPKDAYDHWRAVRRCYQAMIVAHRPRKCWGFGL